MKTWLRKIAEWGITPDTPAENAHHYRLTNILLLITLVASIFQTLVLFVSGAMEAALVNSTAPFVFGVGLLLMKSGKTILARLFVLAISFVGGYAVTASAGPESYLQFIFLLGSALTVIFFATSEKRLLVVAIISPLIAFALLEFTDYQPIFGMGRAELSANQLATMRVGTVLLIWGSMVFHFLYFDRRRRLLQEQLVSNAKMVGMGRMAAGIAHEVNNPLQMIVSRAERMKSSVDKNQVNLEEIGKDASHILNVAMRIASIVKGLLALSRDASADEMQVVDIESVLSTSLDYCRAQVESKNISLKVSEIPQSVCVRGRSTQLSEVVLNVLNNACDAVLGAQHRWIEVQTAAKDEWVEIAVTDSGHGVEPRHRAKIFDPFFTTKPLGQGTGLGLSVSHAIVARHGGQIYLDGSSEKTRFVIRLPRVGY